VKLAFCWPSMQERVVVLRAPRERPVGPLAATAERARANIILAATACDTADSVPLGCLRSGGANIRVPG